MANQRLDFRPYDLPAEARVALWLRDELERGVRSPAVPIVFDADFALKYGCPDEDTLDRAIAQVANPGENFEQLYRRVLEWTEHVQAFEADPLYRVKQKRRKRPRPHGNTPGRS
ncbi:hypothetical protein ACFWB0_02875 [Rhodococcus sp. NPDC060086]|uniref:hypothetical protein n=1 Tax=Rhodococcus sp. NPDC060086 TaxID=3347055 RepID=UPI003666EAE7